MNTNSYTFRQLLTSGTGSADPDSQVCRIVIPMIQRDYAQGRISAETDRVRGDFLKALHDALESGSSATLDFVYGNVADSILTPLDGQQRLTTLYLLYWYAGSKECIPEDEMAFMKQFSYETRYSARDFCRELSGSLPFADMPSRDRKISDAIIDQVWFQPEWKKDPTVSSMLVVFDDIHQQFYSISGLWDKLEHISFYFLPMKDMKLTDELYIKMNSRGMPLTDFEHFKAQLSKQLKAFNPDVEKETLEKIDLNWTDMLWDYRGNNDIIDDEFIQYFRFICDVIYYQEYDKESAQEERIYNEFKLLERYFTKDCPRFEEHLVRVNQYFDCWCEPEKDIKPADMVGRYIARQHEKEKITVSEKEDIFSQCLNGYANQHERKYPLSRFLLLYAFVQFMINRKKQEVKDHFPRRLRIVNNLILNSENEIRDDGQRASRITNMMEQIDEIIIDGEVNEHMENSFNVYQLKEEKAKLEWAKRHTDEECEVLFTLEDHKLLYGQVGILCNRAGEIELDHLDLFSRFMELFDCKDDKDWDRVDRALMSIGYYGQCENDGWRYQFGTKTHRISDPWQSLFHYSTNRDYSNTQSVLLQLLEKYEHPKEALDKIIHDFIRDCEENRKFCWRYYYVRKEYDEDVFRGGYYGKYSTVKGEESGKYGDPGKDNNYLIYVMTTRYRWSAFTYIPYLKEAQKAIGGEVRHNELRKDGRIVTCYDKGYMVKEDNVPDKPIEIEQYDDGIDKEDRIEKLIQFFSQPAE